MESREEIYKQTLDSLFKIVKTTEKQIKKMYSESNIEKPIAGDLVLSIRNMGYFEIKKELKNLSEIVKENKK